jgi:cystathionine gamma-synthase
LPTAEQAKVLAGPLRLIHDATSLGGVESVIEWRRHDPKAPARLLRFSVGLEAPKDLFTRGHRLP